MKVKSVVKVMNFHSLLRVDSSRKKTEKFFKYETELTDFADNILNNRNLILDKKMLKLNKHKRPLNIYIGNDIGFCGSFNVNVNKQAKIENDVDKIIIGKKIANQKENVIMSLTKDEYMDRTKEIEDLLYKVITEGRNSQINLIYNHYYNISKMELLKKRILPLEESKRRKDVYIEDYTIEGDINEILVQVIVLYLSYEIRIAVENSYASENVMRQTITNESLKKIDEIEQEDLRKERKEKNKKSFKKVIENYIKLKDKGE